MRGFPLAVLAVAMVSLFAGSVAWAAPEVSPQVTPEAPPEVASQVPPPVPPKAPPAASRDVPPAVPPEVAPESPPAMAITFSDEAWQALPASVEHVFVSPDDRPWFVLASDPLNADEEPKYLPAIKGAIESQFTLPMPQLRGVLPVLFEPAPSKRIWFVTRDNKTLLGYDGKTWIEKTLRDSLFMGAPTGHAKLGDASRTLAVQGTCFFPDEHGIHTFDGKTWAYQRMQPERDNVSARVMLSSTPDGKRVLGASRMQYQVIWEWEAGTWQSIPLPKTLTTNNLSMVVPLGNDQAMIWTFDKGLVLFPYRGQKKAPSTKELDQWLTDLGGETYASRDAAMQKLIEAGPLANERATPRLATTTDPEILWRLAYVVQATQQDRNSPVKVSNYQIYRPSYAGYLFDGHSLIAGSSIRKGDDPAQPGLLVMDAAGAITVYPGALLGGSISSRGPGDSGFLPWQGTRVWVPGPKPGLLDWEKSALIASIPETRYNFLHAVQADGTVYVSKGEPGKTGSKPTTWGPIKRFRPTLEKAEPAAEK